MFLGTYVEDGLDSDCERHFGDLVDVVVEESRIGQDGVVGQRLHSGAALQARSRLVESDMSIGTNPTQEKLNASSPLDLLLVGYALFFEILGIAIQDVNVGRVDVDVAEEVLVHERVVGLRVLARDPDVLVHVERDDIFEGDFAVLVRPDEVLVDSFWG